MNGVNSIFVISCIFVPLLLISINYESISDFYLYSVPLNKMVLWEDPFFNDPDKFVETSETKGSTCFTTPSMNHFCYAKPRIYEDGIPRTSYVIGENGISGELHFDSINAGEFYFTMKGMSVVKGDTVIITFADNDYRVGNMDITNYEIIDEFEFSTVIKKFDMFIAKCDNYDGTSVTIVQYLGITTIDDADYFVTWHTRADSESGITCDYPQIIQHSFGHDFGI
jgi:hypothetical protein